MSDEEPRLDLAGNPLPRPSSASLPAPGSLARTPGFAPPEPSHAPLKIGLSLGGILLALLIVAAVVLTPKHTPAPTAYTKFTAADHSFSCDAPSGWAIDEAPANAKMSDGSASTVGGVLFHQNSASVDITTDTDASVTAYDLMNNGGNTQSLTGSKAGVLHQQWHKRIAAEHKGYAETQVASFDGVMGDARLAEWTASGNALGFFGPQHGYRLSLAGGGKTAVIVCSCLESDWPSLKPAFTRVLTSFVAGEAGAAAPAVPGSQ